MLTKEQFNILSVFHPDIFLKVTFKQIKVKSLQKSNNVVQIALKEFLKQKIMKTENIGDISIYSLNLDNNLTLYYLTLINENELLKRKFPKTILEDIQKKIFKHTPFFVLIVFGSYAKNKSVKSSDLDIAMIVESNETKKEIIPFLETVKRREVINVDYHVFSRNEFLEMLNSDIENLGKQIYKNNLIYYGFIEYCNMIKGIKK